MKEEVEIIRLPAPKKIEPLECPKCGSWTFLIYPHPLMNDRGDIGLEVMCGICEQDHFIAMAKKVEHGEG